MKKTFDLEDRYFSNEVSYKKTYIKDHINIELEELEKYIIQISYNFENMCFSFNADHKHRDMIERFLPTDSRERDNICDNELLEKYVTEKCERTKTFYSFFAEYLIGIILQDKYNWELCSALIDLSETLSDGCTGVDACMYGKVNNNPILVFGESKFYDTYNSGMKSVVKDFKSNIKNKINSFYKKVKYCDEAMELLKIGKDNRELIDIFGQCTIYFVGFVLHGHNKKNHYSYSHDLSVEKIEKNIREELSIDDKIDLNFRCIMIHLPIKEKKEFIKRILVEGYSVWKMMKEKS